MTSVLLIYPYFKPRCDRSVFRFPPLGIAYLAASLQKAGHQVQLLDCTFLSRIIASQKALDAKAEVTGIYCMVTMRDDCLNFARQLRAQTRLLIAGGPLPTCDPEPFLENFDLVVQGEGEQTLVEILDAYKTNRDFTKISGLVMRSADNQTVYSSARIFCKRLDLLPFPARNLLPNQEYIRFGRKKYGFSITTVMSTRGCPYNCEFCSNVVFGESYRERSAKNVVDEIDSVLKLGYDRISFADDVFTLNKERVLEICSAINQRNLHFKWECLGRVDSMNTEIAKAMKTASCERIFFGIESGSESILKLMNKQITTDQAAKAVQIAHEAGIQVGAFFILCYPGDTDDTVLQTLRFTNSLPLNYLGLSVPYPLPGAALYNRVENQISRDWRPDESPFGSHVVIYKGDFSETKMWFALMKGHAQFRIKKTLGKAAPVILRPFEKLTDGIFKLLK